MRSFGLVLVLAALASAQYPTPTAGGGGSASLSGVFSMGAMLTGVSYPSMRAYNAASGDVDVYTAPPNTRVHLYAGGGFNPAAGTINWYIELKSGGVYYRISINNATLTHTSTVTTSINIILEAGESLSIHTDAAGLNFSAQGVQFDATNALRTVKILSPGAGDNTFYTAPVNKSVIILGISPLASNATSNFAIVAAGTTLITQGCLVASGGSTACAANSVNQIFQIPTGNQGANTRSNLAVVGVNMNAMDFLVLNFDNAATMAWINVIEY